MKQIKDFPSYYTFHYGADLENKIDPIDKMEYAIRLFCSDCCLKCGGAKWDTCSAREETLEIIRGKA